MAKYTFPKEFLWGTATSAYQIEGNNKNSDWWEWEYRDRRKDFNLLIHKSNWPLEPSLDACDSYNRYEEDFDLASNLNNNAIRIGLEWARIEPKQGEFDQNEIEHYKKVLQAAQDRGLKTFVTLHHFTNPIWFSKKHGWTNLGAPKMFAAYAKKCAEEFGEIADTFLTINEPQVYAFKSYLDAGWAPQKHNPISTLVVMMNFWRAHNKAYDAIKEISDIRVGIVKNISNFYTEARWFNLVDRIATKILYYLNAGFFLDRTKKRMDVIGLNHYFSNRIKFLRARNVDDKFSDLGWWLYPPGIKPILLDLKKYGVPVYITENGLADAKDEHRAWYIKEILKACAEAIEEGANLQGYFHWSLLDNYEWAEGFWPRFGLVEIDRTNNLQRKPRPSYYEYAKICENGTIDM